MDSVGTEQRVLNYQSPDGANRPTMPGAWTSLTLLLCINLFNYVDRNVLAAVEPRIQHALFPHAAENDPHVLRQMGFLGTAFFVSYMLLAPIFGWLADRTSRWMLIGISVIVWSLATGGTGLASIFVLMLIMRLFVGVGEAGYGPAAPTIISDLFPEKRRGIVLACFYVAIPVGSAMGYVLGGWIEGRFGWRAAFFAVTPPGLLLGILCFFMKEPPRGLSDGASAPRSAKLADYLVLLKTPSYVLDCAGMIAMTFAIGGISFWIPRYISQERHVGSLTYVNTMFGLITVVAGILSTLLGGLAGDQLRKRFSGAYFLVSGIGIILACPFIWLMVHQPFPMAWVMLFLAEFCLFFNTGPSNTILANVTHPSMRATAFAFNIFIIHLLGDVPSPPLLGEIGGRFGWNAAFGVVIAATALGGVFWLFGMKYLAADTAKAHTRFDAMTRRTDASTA